MAKMVVISEHPLESHHSSLIDRIDPRTRIIAAFALAITIVLCNKLIALGIALSIAIGYLVTAQLLQRALFLRILALNLFLLFFVTLLPFTVGGTPLFTIGNLVASQEGLLQAIRIGLKANAVVITLLALVGSMNATLLGHALASLHMPRKLVHLLLFTVRYLGVINREYLRMRDAMKTRAFVLKSNLHTLRSIGFLLGMLLVKSLERSERVMNAMKCRGYTGEFYLLNELTITRADHIFATINLLLIIALAGINLS